MSAEPQHPHPFAAAPDDRIFQSLEKSRTGGSNARPARGWKSSPAVLAALAALISILPYLVSIRFAFVYDDHGSIVENPFLQQPGALLKTLTLGTFVDPHVLDGQRPLVILSYLIDKAIWGFNPTGFHITSVMLHAVSVALVFFLCGTIGASRRASFAAALLFGLHPVATEAVQLPAFREDLLATAFTLAFLVFAARRKIVPAVTALALALCGKETAVVAPLLLGWMWICFPSLRPAPRQLITMMAAGMVLVSLYFAVTFTHRPLQAAGQAWNGLALRWPENISTMPWLFALTLKTLLVPYPLCADYVVKPVALAAVRFFIGLSLLTGMAAAAFLSRRRLPGVAFALGWLLFSFLPVSNLVPLFNPLADRYLYLPATGFALLFAGLWMSRTRLRAFSGPFGRPALPFALVCALYLGVSVHRLQDWRNDETLWNSTAEAEPGSARAQTWLGLLAAGRGDLAEARRRYERADELNPHNVHALINLAVLDGQAGDIAQAEQKLRTAVERRPDFPDGWWNLAAALSLQGRLLEAKSVARRAAALDPLNPRVEMFK